VGYPISNDDKFKKEDHNKYICYELIRILHDIM